MTTNDPTHGSTCTGDCRSPDGALDLIEDAAASLDCRGQIVSVNAAWAAAATARGSTPDKVGPGVDYLDVCDRAQGRFTGGAATAAAGVRAVLCGEEDDFALDYPCPSAGVEHWFTLRVTPFGDACVGAIVTHHDITDLKLAELWAMNACGGVQHGVERAMPSAGARGRVHRIARRLETQLLRRNPASVVVLDHDGVVVYWNDTAATLSGRSSDEVVGHLMADLGLGPTHADLLHEIQRGLAATGRWEGEYDGRRSDGSVVAVHSIIERVDEAGLDFRGVVISTIDISERRRLEESLSFRALHDELTGLPDRRLFFDQLTGAMARDGRSQGVAAVMSIDFDDFRGLNEARGPLIGDEVLRQAAKRIQAALRDGDAVARRGGDTFVACLEDLTDVAAAEAMARAVQVALRQPFAVGDEPVVLSSCVGMALASSAPSATGVMRNADAALSVAKGDGVGRIEVFDDAAAREARLRRHLVADLEQALEVGEIHAAFQSEVDLNTGELVGFEALARWAHPERGPVPPDEFIGIAEDSGLISRITRVILNEACQALAAWRSVDPDRRLYVAVNISPRQLSEPSLASTVRDALEAARVDAGCLCLEVTESALADTEMAASALRELQEIGVAIALDDFGTGYSSLGHLHRFPLDYLKIDRSFVSAMDHPPHDEAIITAVIAVAHAMGLRTIAEGIESPHQAERLAAMGCDIGQGYLWSQAVPLRDAAALVRHWNATSSLRRPRQQPG